jgi:hypothetical protein
MLILPINKLKVLGNDYHIVNLQAIHIKDIKLIFLCLVHSEIGVSGIITIINIINMYQVKVIADYVFPYELISLGTNNGISFDYWDDFNNIKSKHIELFEFNIYGIDNDIKNILIGLSIISKLRCFSKNRKQPDIIKNSIKNVITSSIIKLNKLINDYSTKQTKENY